MTRMEAIVPITLFFSILVVTIAMVGYFTK